jgi:hypothetical protein
MVLNIPSVELQDQLALRFEPFIFGTTMRTLAAEQSLVPAAARLDVMYTNERLWTHLLPFSVTLEAAGLDGGEASSDQMLVSGSHNTT